MSKLEFNASTWCNIILSLQAVNWKVELEDEVEIILKVSS